MQMKALTMIDALGVQAKELLAAAPASVKLPAGTGKTHLLAAAAKEAAKQESRSLILTHTNAGVDAIRERLKRFDVPSTHYKIDTITGWAFTLAKSYQIIAGVSIPNTPDWSHSSEYLRGAVNVANTSSIKQVLLNSYDYLFVDEYQDCTQIQHEFIVALSISIPLTMVFGDPLQGIFGFRDNILVNWETEVERDFRSHSVELFPHRWRESNPSLGQFTLNIRPWLQVGNQIDFGRHSHNGVHFVRGDSRNDLAATCFRLTGFKETVAVLTKWPTDEDRISQTLSGRFNVIEPISGQRMIECLKTLPNEGDHNLAHWFAATAKKFHVGLSGIDSPLMSKLREGKTVSQLRRQGLQEFIDVLVMLQQNPTYSTLLEAQGVPSRINGVRCSHREAWRDIFRAVEYQGTEGTLNMVENLAAVRSRYKHMNRSLPRLIVSRTLIVKGLEFDHVVIDNLKNFSDPRNLYVALTRARKSVTILGDSSSIVLANDD